MSLVRFPVKFGNYILLDRLSSGGMAEVYRAKMRGVEKFERLMAIKCILPHLAADEQFTAMFIDEAKLAAQLTHANIVQIYELGRSSDQLYIAMELVNGCDLRHVLRTAVKQEIKIPLAFAVYVVSKVAEGLDFAHRKHGVDGEPLHLVHRDVSPQNILVSYDGEIKVVDFGIAKATARSTETQTGILKGKLAYMAPEQLTGKEVDRRADIFALGVVLFETLTRMRLFKGDSDLSILEKAKEARVPSIRESIPELPGELDDILQKALAKDPNQRYQWASEFSEDLETLLIQEKNIFGTKRAKQFMASMFSKDIEELTVKLKRYAAISDEDCIEDSKKVKVLSEETSILQPMNEWSVSTSKVQLPKKEVVEKDPKEIVEIEEPTPLWLKFLIGTVIVVAFILIAVVGYLLRRELSPQKSSVAVIEQAPKPVEKAPVVAPEVVPPSPVPVTSSVQETKEPEVVKETVKEEESPKPAPVKEPEKEPVKEPAKPPVKKPASAPVKKVAKPMVVPAAKEDFGFISIKANGVITARIFVDGKDVGYSPVFSLKLKTGKYQIRAVEEINGASARYKIVDTVITTENTRQSPLRLVIEIK